jgi:hypothetical protein
MRDRALIITALFCLVYISITWFTEGGDYVSNPQAAIIPDTRVIGQ